MPPTPPTLTWDQVHAWRLNQHALINRAPRADWLNVITRINALHAQMMSAAELSLWARVADLEADAVQEALWGDRTLIKSWVMRGTLHLIPSREYGLYVGTMKNFRHYRRGSWYKYFGINESEMDLLLSSMPQVLSDQGMTREQVADAVAERLNTPQLRELMRSGWGSLFKPPSFNGVLCFGPSKGQNVTFVLPEAWIGAYEAVDPSDALDEMVKRHLAAYAPATLDEITRWWGFEASFVKKSLKRLGDQVQPVEVEGFKALALTESLDDMRSAHVENNVRLLPHFDPYTVGLAKQSAYLMPDEFRDKVYRAQGWISPVVLVNGRIVGVWESEKSRSKFNVKLDLFAGVDQWVYDGIAAETEKLKQFLTG